MYAETIKDYLDKHGITQPFLSKKSGIHGSVLYGIFYKGRRMTIEEYAEICKALKLNMDYFREIVEGKESENPEPTTKKGGNYGNSN